MLKAKERPMSLQVVVCIHYSWLFLDVAVFTVASLPLEPAFIAPLAWTSQQVLHPSHNIQDESICIYLYVFILFIYAHE